jgi:hypothetical protein
MPEFEKWGRDQLQSFVEEHYGEDAFDAMVMIRNWLARGDGAAIYTNHDLSSSTVGEPRIASYGSAAAQLEGATPPKQLPDGIPRGAINWRFQLDAVCGGPASDDASPDWRDNVTR